MSPDCGTYRNLAHFLNRKSLIYKDSQSRPSKESSNEQGAAQL